MIYNLSTISGTSKFVLKELETKYPEIKIISVSTNKITFESDIEDIREFRKLQSATHIEIEGSKKLNLFRREWRIQSSPAGINPALAHIMCTIADVTEKDIVMDPFCGAGTIPITASVEFKAKMVFASDISGTAIEQARENFISSRIKEKKYRLFRSNVSQVMLKKGIVSKIISNLPFGIRVRDHDENTKSYKDLAHLAELCLRPDGTIVLYTVEKNLLKDAFENTNFKLIHEYNIRQGGLTPSIFVYKRNK